MAETISWIATIATIVAASMTASNLGSRITGYGFCVFLAGSLCWLTVGVMTGQLALSWTNVVLTILNIFGIWRWLGRQARMEEGATSAREASEGSPGESLFPVSLLMKGPIEARSGEPLGNCVDAMAGEGGQLRYVVASQGGVAGMGETLRRLPWERVRMGSGKLVTEMDSLDRLEEIQKDEWPAN
ncbi:MAG: PRC-barrel domain containing protein [Sphingomonas sp.]|nr:PRC-barrel domain containing protein [Sphingomonas sp.]